MEENNIKFYDLAKEIFKERLINLPLDYHWNNKDRIEMCAKESIEIANIFLEVFRKTNVNKID